MTGTGLRYFDKSIQKAHEWINDACREIGTDDREKAYMALKATLIELRDCLSVEEAAQLAAQLPMVLRGAYYENWKPAATPIKVRDREEFIAKVYAHLANDTSFDPEKVVEGIFRVLEQRVSEGEIGDVKAILPKQLKELWPAASTHGIRGRGKGSGNGKSATEAGAT